MGSFLCACKKKKIIFGVGVFSSTTDISIFVFTFPYIDLCGLGDTDKSHYFGD